MKQSIFLVTCFLSLVLCEDQNSERINVATTSGGVLGHPTIFKDPRSNTSVQYTEFTTIPFAKPPIGDLRFAAPQPLEPDHEVAGDVTFRRMCYQLGDLFGLLPSLIEADEDCLYLNVYVPGEWPPPKPLPVMIWFTGGMFVFGSGNWYGPDYWMQHDVIIVTVNYRLGPFGFLTLGIDEAAGNQGLLDQRMSMIWVRDNIGNFGGDPDQVTIAGESAGSFSVFYHMMSPGSQGLFKRVIGQSGMGALSPSFHHWQGSQGIRLGKELALLLGCASLNVREELDCMKTKSALALNAVELENGFISQPVIDVDYASDPFFPTDPLDALELGEFATDVDVLLGSNQNEGLLLTEVILNFHSLFFDIIVNHWDIWGPLLLFHKHALEISPEDVMRAYKVLEYYCGTTDVTPDHIVNMTDMFTDSFFLFGITKYIDEYHLQFSTKPVYQYMNSYHNENYQFNIFHIPPLTPTLPGVSHGDELFLIWSPLAFAQWDLSDNDMAASLQMTTLWSNFIKTGDPGPAWSPVTSDDKRFLNLGLEKQMQERDDYYLQRMEFWRSL